MGARHCQGLPVGLVGGRVYTRDSKYVMCGTVGGMGRCGDNDSTAMVQCGAMAGWFLGSGGQNMVSRLFR